MDATPLSPTTTSPSPYPDESAVRAALAKNQAEGRLLRRQLRLCMRVRSEAAQIDRIRQEVAAHGH